MYADIIVDISHEKLDKTFQYRIPEELCQAIYPGVRVRIPFGSGGRQISGYVVSVSGTPKFDAAKTKDIIEIEKGSQDIESKLIELAAWIHDTYGSTMNQSLKTVLPVKQKMADKEQKKIVLSLTKNQAQEYLAEAMRKKYKARERILEYLLALPQESCDYTKALKDLRVTGSTLASLQKAGVIQITSSRVYRGTAKEECGEEREQPARPPVLNEEQQTVLDGIWAERKKRRRPCLVHGITGSGKTLVYMELIERMRQEGKQSIVLIPEIALTYQTLGRFYARFGDDVAVLHSRLSAGERSDQMERAKTGEIQVMVGPRSALFTPFPKLGLIIIDEEHENTYKSESMPRYHARDVAAHRVEMEKGLLVLGSATPSLESYYKAVSGEYQLFHMEERYGGNQLPEVEVVDMRQELKRGNRSILSSVLQKDIQKRLEKGEQTMLFLNRRGYAGFISCRSCGYVAKCPHCDVSMSIHRGGRLMCHYCGYETKEYKTCPSCGSPYIGGFKAGTQQIEQTVQKMFPASRILRMDYDTTRKKDGYANILREFAQGNADILIGTQMIVKGHDFPKVTLMGILAADMSLNASDFRSGERTFQLLAQAVGRAGRGGIPGEAIIQTYQPEHYSIQAAITQDYQAFYQEEISYRKLMGYPPAASLMAVIGIGQREEQVNHAMEHIKAYVMRLDKNSRLQMIGPAPDGIGKIQDMYRRVLYIKYKDRKVLTVLKNRLEEYIEIDPGFQTMNIQFDFHR